MGEAPFFGRLVLCRITIYRGRRMLKKKGDRYHEIIGVVLLYTAPGSLGLMHVSSLLKVKGRIDSKLPCLEQLV